MWSVYSGKCVNCEQVCCLWDLALLTRTSRLLFNSAWYMRPQPGNNDDGHFYRYSSGQCTMPYRNLFQGLKPIQMDKKTESC